jgi:hypothetical protein
VARSRERATATLLPTAAKGPRAGGPNHPYGTALVFAVLASAPLRPHNTSDTEAPESDRARGRHIAGRPSNRKVKRISTARVGSLESAAVSPRCSCTHASPNNIDPSKVIRAGDAWSP